MLLRLGWQINLNDDLCAANLARVNISNLLGAGSMPISVSCSCGKKLSVKDELAGKRGKCPACGVMLTIPQPPQPEAFELDLSSLSDEFTQPAAEIIPEVVKRARAQAGWVDPRTEYKVAGDPLSDDVGKVFAPPPTIAPLKSKSTVREEVEGEFVCPRCSAKLERTFTLLNFLTAFASSYTTGFYLRPTTPYMCHFCGPIRYQDLRGETRRTVDRRTRKIQLGCLISLLAFGLLVGVPFMIAYNKVAEQQEELKKSLPKPKSAEEMKREREQEYQRFLREQEESKRKSEEKQRERDEAAKKIREKTKELYEKNKQESDDRLKKLREQDEQSKKEMEVSPKLPAANPFQQVE